MRIKLLLSVALLMLSAVAAHAPRAHFTVADIGLCTSCDFVQGIPSGDTTGQTTGDPTSQTDVTVQVSPTTGS